MLFLSDLKKKICWHFTKYPTTQYYKYRSTESFDFQFGQAAERTAMMKLTVAFRSYVAEVPKFYFFLTLA